MEAERITAAQLLLGMRLDTFVDDPYRKGRQPKRMGEPSGGNSKPVERRGILIPAMMIHV